MYQSLTANLVIPSGINRRSASGFTGASRFPLKLEATGSFGQGGKANDSVDEFHES